MTGGGGTAALYFLPFLKIPINIFNAQQTNGDCKYAEVFDCAKSRDGFQTKGRGVGWGGVGGV